MNTTLLLIVKQIIARYGEGVLADPKRLKAFFSDLAKDEPKPMRLAFGRAIEEGAFNALKTASDAAERAARKEALARRLRDEHGLDPALSAEALDVLEAALFEDENRPLLCKNCGKEQRASWRACPYCGADAEEDGAPPPEQRAPPVKKKRVLRAVLIAAGLALGAAAAVTAGIKIKQERDNRLLQISVLLVIGKTHFDGEEYDQAIDEFTEVLKMDPRNVDAYHYRGRAYEFKEDYDRALADFTAALRIEPKNADRHLMRGIVYKEKEDYDNAIADFTKALELDPENAHAYAVRGLTYYFIYYEQEEYDLVIADLNKAVQLDPDNATTKELLIKVYFERIRVYMNEKNADGIAADCAEILRIDPDNVRASRMLELAKWLQSMSEYDE